MITIDIIHEYEAKTEKPHEHRTKWLVDEHKPLDPVFNLAYDRHNALVRAAQEARLIKQVKTRETEQQPVDVKRYAEKVTPSITVLEKYARKVFRLAHKV